MDMELVLENRITEICEAMEGSYAGSDDYMKLSEELRYYNDELVKLRKQKADDLNERARINLEDVKMQLENDQAILKAETDKKIKVLDIIKTVGMGILTAGLTLLGLVWTYHEEDVNGNLGNSKTGKKFSDCINRMNRG